jgi:hypothetical protein
MVTREDVDRYLLRMELDYEEVEEGMWLVNTQEDGAPLPEAVDADPVQHQRSDRPGGEPGEDVEPDHHRHARAAHQGEAGGGRRHRRRAQAQGAGGGGGRQAQEWERRAMLAVREGRDDLARRRSCASRSTPSARTRSTRPGSASREETERLKDSLRQLNAKIEEARRKKNLLIAKQKRAEAQKRIHETMSGLSDRSAFEAFDRMAQRIEDNERRRSPRRRSPRSSPVPPPGRGGGGPGARRRAGARRRGTRRAAAAGGGRHPRRGDAGGRPHARPAARGRVRGAGEGEGWRPVAAARVPLPVHGRGR